MEIARAPTTTPHWSHEPAHDLIGVSVFQNNNQYSLRFHIRLFHLDRLEKTVKSKLGIRGSAQNGFLLAPDAKRREAESSCPE
jgi:hypothetical protein